MLREIAATLTANVDSKSVQSFMGVLDSAKASIAGLGGVLAGGAFGVFIKETLDYNDALDDMSQRTGASAEDLQRLGYMLKLNGAEAADAERALFIFNKQLADSKGGIGGTANDLAALGISMKGSNGHVKTAIELLPDIADKVAEAGTEAEKTGIAVKFFSKAGLGMLPMLKKGREGISELSKEFDDLGLGVSGETIANTAEVNDQIDRLGFVGKATALRLVGALVPTLMTILGWVTKAAGSFAWLTKQTNVMRHAAVAISGALALKFLPQIWKGVQAFRALQASILGATAPLWVIVAVLAAIYLVFEDLWVLMNGGDSFIGGILDKFGTAGEKATLIKSLKDAWEGVKTSLASVKPLLSDLWKSIAEGSSTWVPALAGAFVGVVKGVVAGITAISSLVAIVAKLASGDVAGAVKAANQSSDAIFGRKQSMKEIGPDGATREVSANVGGLYGISQAEYLQKAKENGLSDEYVKSLEAAIAKQKLETTVTVTVPPGTDPSAVKVTNTSNADALAAVKTG